jgi:hypothetical protein
MYNGGQSSTPLVLLETKVFQASLCSEEYNCTKMILLCVFLCVGGHLMRRAALGGAPRSSALWRASSSEIGLVQMLVRRSPFPHDLPINGLCSHEFFVLARAVSATPPSIVIVALVLGGPERVRVVLNSSSRSDPAVQLLPTRVLYLPWCF